MWKKLFKWEAGRQNSGYYKMLLARLKWPLKFDFYLLKFLEGSEIKTHLAPVPKGRHFRINFIIKKAFKGGEFICNKTLFSNKRIKYFRPDLEKHSVTKIEKGTRLVLSIGWIN